MTLKGLRWRHVLEAAIVVAVFAVSARLGYRYVREGHIKTPTEWEQAPASMIACGHGLTEPSIATPAMTDFLLRRRESVSCDEVTGKAPPRSATLFALDSRYSIYAAGAALWLGGVSWRTLDVYIASLFGLSLVFAYALFRLAAGPALALIGTMVLLYSNHLGGLVMLRDYVKEPTFFALWLGLAWLLRRGWQRASPALYVPAFVAGAIVGIGMGFRVDVIVGVPAVVGVIMFAIPGYTRATLWIKLRALAAFLLAFAVTGAPILSSMTRGSNSSHVTILGLTTGFTRVLALERPLYDLGNIYSDGFAYTMIVAHADLVQHERQPVAYLSAEYDRFGAKLLSDVARRFPADVLVRPLAATAQIIRYPFDESALGEYRAIGVLNSSPPARAVAAWREAALRIVDGYALLLAVLVLVVVSIRDWRVGLMLALFVLYFCGYSMLQFTRRHTFHLDLIPIGMLLIALQLVIDLIGAAVRRIRHHAALSADDARAFFRRVAHAAVALGALAAVVALPLFAARRWQQRHVAGMIEQTLALPSVTLQTPREPLADTTLVGDMPAATWLEIFWADKQAWTTATLFRVPMPTVTKEALESIEGQGLVYTEYFRVEIGGAACHAGKVQVGLKYTGSEPNVNKEYTRVFDVRVDPADGPSQLLVPVFYHFGGSTSRFDGFAVPADSASCITAVRRVESARAVPLPLLVAVLPPNWRATPLYQRLQDPPEVTLNGTPVKVPRF